MVNRRGQNVSFATGRFDPRPALSSQLISVARPDGSTFRQEGEAYQRFAQQLSSYADEFAVAEGERAGRAAGQDEDFRPSGSMTLRGRAHDRAAIDSYMDNLQAGLRMDMAQAYEEFSTLPVAEQVPSRLAGMMEELRGQYDGRVFDEIRGSFESQWAVWETSYRKAAVDQWHSRQLDEARANTIGLLQASQTATARAILLNPNDDGLEALLANERAEREATLQAAVTRGDMSATQAQAAGAASAREDQLFLERARIGSLDTIEAVEAYGESFRERLESGDLDVLGQDGMIAVQGALDSRRNALRTEGERLGNRATGKLDDIVKRAADGFDIPSDELAAARSQALAMTDQDGEPIFADAVRLADAKLTIAHTARGQSPEQIEQIARALRQRQADGGADANTADLIRFTETLAKNKRTALATDMIGVAERDKLIAPTPLTFGAPEFGEQMHERIAAARAAANTYERRVQFLRPDEKEQLAALTQAGVDQALAVAESIVGAAGNDAPAILREIGGDAPMLAGAGAILVNGGSRQAARDLFEAQQLKAIPGQSVRKIDPTDDSAVRSKVIGTAFREHVEDGQRIIATGLEIAAIRMERARVDPMGKEAQDIYERSLQEAAGARFVEDRQFGGVGPYRPVGSWQNTHRVVVPPGVDAARFGDLIRGINDDDLAELSSIPLDELGVLPGQPSTVDGVPFMARDLHRATPVATSGGYRFVMGDPADSPPRYITTADGQPFLLRWDDVEHRLRARMPNAFLGGS
jgi:hypothetical protein